MYGLGNWKKKKGFATVVLNDGSSCRAEVHWYEAHGIGKLEMKLREVFVRCIMEKYVICLSNEGYAASLEVRIL